MDGFLIVLDKEANILYVSETIAGYVGLSQVSLITLYICTRCKIVEVCDTSNQPPKGTQ